MGAAPAQMPGERLGDFGAAGIGVSSKQRRGSNEDARQAIPALAGLHVQESSLQRVRTLRRADAFERRDRLARQVADLDLAGWPFLALHDYGAGPALPGSAPILCRLKLQMIAQRLEQCRRVVDAETARFAIDGQFNVSDHRAHPGSKNKSEFI